MEMKIHHRLPMGIVICFLMLLGWSSVTVRAADDAIAALRTKAAKFYSDREYKQAYDAWKQLAASNIPEVDRPKLEFFLADSLWRSQPGAPQVDEARALLAAIAEVHPDSSLGAEAWESTADSWLANDRDWPRAWEAYQRALTIWAASEDVDLARERFLAIVWKATGPPGESNRVTQLPLDVLNDALRIAKTKENIARARFFLGQWLVDQDDVFSIRRAGSEWSQVIAMGRDTAVYESALFELAKWSLVAGESRWEPDGSLEVLPNFQRAYGLFQRLLEEFPNSKYAPDASARVAELTRPSLALATDKNYLPGSEPWVVMDSRNVTSVDFSLFRVDLNAAFEPTPTTEPDDWQSAIRLDALKPMRQWSFSIENRKPFQPGRTEIPMDPIAEPGAYVLEASSAGLKSKSLIIITSAAAILRAASDQAVALVCDVGTGQAASSVIARLWHAEREDAQWKWTPIDASLSDVGLLRFALPEDQTASAASLLFLAQTGQSPVFLTSYASRALSAPDGWRFQVITDRPHGHPGDDFGWKLMVRQTNGESLRTPAGQAVEWRIIAPDGDVADRGEIQLNEFGSGWGVFKSSASQPLGAYSIEFYSQNELIGEATLFRLDARSQAPFSVTLGLSGQSGRTVRLGETLRILMRAEYPQGGGVPDALVSVTLRESPYQRTGTTRGVTNFSDSSGEVSRVIRQDEMRTAPDGSVVIEVLTPPDSPGDLLYDVDVIVRDASGREVSGSRQFVVARHGYFADIQSPQRIVEPGSSTDLLIRTRDANDTPVSTDGTLIVKREDTSEVWIAPDGREVSGEALDALRQANFPPPGDDGWILKSRDPKWIEVARKNLKTDAAGWAKFPFSSDQDGLFRIFWESSDAGGPPVTAETAIWVSSAATQMVTYRGMGVQVIAEPASARADGSIQVLVVTDTPNRDVMLAVGAGQNLLYTDLIHLSGNARLVRLESDPRFAPNVFVQAAMVRSGEFFYDTAEVRFANWANLLNVEMLNLDPRMEPGENAELKLRVKDAEGNPARAELALVIYSSSANKTWNPVLQNPLDIFHGGLRTQGGSLVSSLSESKTVFETRALRDAMRARPADSTPAGGTHLGFQSTAYSYSGSSGGESGLIASQDDESTSFLDRDAQPVIALWRPALRTTSVGEVSVPIVFPELLTKWHLATWVISRGESFGFLNASTTTTLPLLSRLYAPNFLIQGDQTMIRGYVQNGSDSTLRVRAKLESDLLTINEPNQDARLAAGESSNFLWPVVAATPGLAEVSLDIQGSEKSDVLNQSLQVVPRGREVVLSAAGSIRGEAVEIAMELPQQIEIDSPVLHLILAGSLDEVLLDALPELVELNPINMDETLAQFVPLTRLRAALASVDKANESIIARIAHAGMVPDDPATWMQNLESQGLQRIYDQQNVDGSWSWVPGGPSDPWVTGYVIWSLRLLQTSGVGIREDKLESAVSAMQGLLKSDGLQPAMKAWILHALGCLQSTPRKPSKDELAALDQLWKIKDQLSADVLAWFAMACGHFAQTQRAEELVTRLESLAKTEVSPEGALISAQWTSTSKEQPSLNTAETTAFALLALSAIKPDSSLTDAAITTLVRMRTGLSWADARTSSIVIASLMPYVSSSPAKPLEKLDITVNKTRIEWPDSQGRHGSNFQTSVTQPVLSSGKNLITIRRGNSDASIYYSLALGYHTESQAEVSDPVFSINREFFKLDAFETLLDGWRYEKIQWKAGDSIRQNSRLEAELVIQSSMAARYVRVTDWMTAGLEPVDIQSGQTLYVENASGEKIPAMVEVRDQAVVFQFPTLPAGQWKLRYQLRATRPGTFYGPPAVISDADENSPPASSASWQVKIDP